MQYILILLLFLFSFGLVSTPPVQALGIGKESAAVVDNSDLVSHKALYDISLTSKSSGAQIVNIKGKMFYETKNTCEGWLTNHQFNLRYEYADSPGMVIKSDFSTYEPFDGKAFNFSTRRRRDGEVYEEYRGQAYIEAEKGEATFSIPENLTFDLSDQTVFPVEHTKELIRHAKNQTKFFRTVVFDGSDGEGPVDINSFIGSKISNDQKLSGEKVDANLLKGQAWPVRMAVFPIQSESPTAEYEMSMIFHENGIVSDMHIDYSNFSVRQKLLALEKIEVLPCGTGHNTQKKKKK